MNISNFEVITTDNKAQRDVMFQQLRQSELPNERQVVKFSGNTLKRHPLHDGEPLVVHLPHGEVRGVYVSTWSVAYPKD